MWYHSKRHELIFILYFSTTSMQIKSVYYNFLLWHPIHRSIRGLIDYRLNGVQKFKGVICEPRKILPIPWCSSQTITICGTSVVKKKIEVKDILHIQRFHSWVMHFEYFDCPDMWQGLRTDVWWKLAFGCSRSQTKVKQCLCRAKQSHLHIRAM